MIIGWSLYILSIFTLTYYLIACIEVHESKLVTGLRIIAMFLAVLIFNFAMIKLGMLA